MIRSGRLVRAHGRKVRKPALGKRESRLPWRFSLTSRELEGQMYSMRTPEWLEPAEVEAMEKNPRILRGLTGRYALVASADYTYKCPESDVVRQIGQKLLDEHRSELLRIGLLSMLYGRQVAQIVWKKRALEFEVAEKGKRFVKSFPDAYWIEALRELDPLTSIPLIDRIGDFAGISTIGNRIPIERSALWVHKPRFGRLDGWSALLPAWRPWKMEQSVEDDWNVYCQTRASPPIKSYAPSIEEWTQYRSSFDDSALDEPTDPQEAQAAAVTGVWSNGVIQMNSAVYVDEDGRPSTVRMFDAEVLELPERSGEYEKALAWCRMSILEGLLMPAEMSGQAAAKQADRRAFAFLFPDQVDWAYFTERYVIRPVVELVVGHDAPQGAIEPGAFAENKRELFLEILRMIGDSKQHVGDLTLSTSILADVERLLRELGAPTHDADAVGRQAREEEEKEKEEAAKAAALGGSPDEDPRNTGRTAGRPRKPGKGSEGFDSKDPDAKRREQGSSGAGKTTKADVRKLGSPIVGNV